MSELKPGRKETGAASAVKKRRVLLLGPPNVGKSVIFNRLTGLDVRVANYAGTTVEYAAGEAALDGHLVDLVDVPGTYTLHATNEAEQVAVTMLENGADTVVCVLDAANLEGSLYLLFQVLERGLPTVAVLNRSDLARDRGCCADTALMTRELGVPVVPAVAVSGAGLDAMRRQVVLALEGGVKAAVRPAASDGDRWRYAEDLAVRAQSVSPHLPLRRQLWGDMLVRPWPGLPLALLILGLMFGLVVGAGMGLRNFILAPFFDHLVIAPLVLAVQAAVPPGLWQNVLIGEYGLLVKGIEWPFTLVLPYLLSFYTALSLLEDSGYLPRLAILVDGLLNRVGLQGGSVIPLLLGYGCGIPALLATRALASRRERLVVAALVSLAVPCVAQTGALISLLAERSLGAVAGLFLLSVASLLLAGVVLHRLLPGQSPDTVIEVPELLLPRLDVILKRNWQRLKHFIGDGALPMVAAVGLAALLYETGIMAGLGRLLSPLVVTWLHLPREAATPLVLGIFRRELAVLPLLDMDLTTLQLATGAVVGLFYVPCIAMVGVLGREFGLRMALGVLVITTSAAFLMGGVIARLGLGL